MAFIIYIALYLVHNSLSAIICSVHISDYYQSFQLLQLEPMPSCYPFVHEHSCGTTIQEYFYSYTFMCIQLLYSNGYPYFSQYFESPPNLPLITPLFCCAFRFS